MCVIMCLSVGGISCNFFYSPAKVGEIVKTMLKKQKELLSLGKRKRSRGLTLIGLVYGVLVLVVGALLVTPLQSTMLFNKIENIKTQSYLILSVPGNYNCFPKQLSYLITGIPTAENNVCGTSASTTSPYLLESSFSGISSDNNTVYLYFNSISLSFVEVGSTDSKLLMLKVNGDKNIIGNLKGKICEGGETTNPYDVLASELSRCYYWSDELYYSLDKILKPGD